MSKKRVAILAFGLESSTFTPLVAHYNSFTIRRDNFCSAPLLELFSKADIEAIPVMLVSGTPNGLVPEKDFRALEDEVFSKLRSLGHLDGILLSMHGSMLLEDLSHGELRFLRRLRNELGRQIPVSVRLDLHGNVPDGFVELCDAVTALRTAPHRDNIETILRAAKLLVRMLEEGTRPVCAQYRLPIIIPGEWAVTEREPARSLYEQINQIESANSQIWSASIMVGFAWADVHWAGASTIVCAATLAEARSAALALAEQFWKCRKDLDYEGEHYATEEALLQAKASTQNPVFLMESGDNITAGSTGKDANLLLTLLDKNFERTLYLQFFSEEFCQTYKDTALGSEILFSAYYGDNLSEQRILSGTLVGRNELQGVLCLRTQVAGVELVVTSRRVPIAELEQFKALGIELSNYRFVVCKLGYLLPHLHDLAPRTINILTRGPTSPDIFQFSYSRVRRPIYPLDPDTPEPDFCA